MRLFFFSIRGHDGLDFFNDRSTRPSCNGIKLVLLCWAMTDARVVFADPGGFL